MTTVDEIAATMAAVAERMMTADECVLLMAASLLEAKAQGILGQDMSESVGAAITAAEKWYDTTYGKRPQD